MWKFKTRKSGFTIIEVMCSFSVFTILFLTAMSIKLCTIKMQVDDDKIALYTEYIQDIKTEVLSNISKDQLNTLIGEGKIYISNNVLDESHLRVTTIADLFTTSYEEGKPYLQISVINGDLEEITLVMHTYVVGRQENITANFYKGNY
jgi:type II secretory pathway pseudopilin PulG